MSDVKPLRVYVDNEYMPWIRILLILFAIMPGYYFFDALLNGRVLEEARNKHHRADSGYYLYIMKHGVFVVLFAYLATFDIRVKDSKTNYEE